MPVEFVLFGLTLLGVALFHHYTLRVALLGLTAITVYKFLFVGFTTGPGLAGLADHMLHEWVILANLFGLLLGFALLARHFEDTHLPRVLPHILPDNWRGGFLLLVMVFVLSSFLDNIAAAMIGGSMAATVFRSRVHIGYLAAIVAAANAGGAGSVIGDTTTTMMWIQGVAPSEVLHAYIASGVALLVFGIPAALQQQRYSPVVKEFRGPVAIDWPRVLVVAVILIVTAGANIATNIFAPQYSERYPVLGMAVWGALLATALVRRPQWSLLRGAASGSVFLLALVLCASLMPVDKLPAASWHTAFGLGFLSAVFDNIPLTKLALEQGGFDWGMLAYAVGFGGSMIWFGSSAGVALANQFPEARSVGRWLTQGWHVALAYVIGFGVLLATLGWHPGVSH